MPYGMYLSAEGAQALSSRMEVIANNMANVNTPGFKRDVVTFQARLAEAVEQGLVEDGSGAVEDVGGGVMLENVATNFEPGPMNETGIRTDLAIQGEGFFQVQRPDGQMLLTRAGNFTVNSATGQLVTQDTGYPVVGAGGSPVAINPALGPIQINQDGSVTQIDGEHLVPVGGLAVMKPASLGDLVKVGQNMFRSLGNVEPVPSADRQILQGFLEGSGVNPTREMMSLIETSRLFEANTKLIQFQDDATDSLISRVLQG